MWGNRRVAIGRVAIVGFMLGAVGALAGAVPGGPPSIFDLEQEASPRVVVTVSAEAPAADAVGGMVGELHGMLAVLSKAEATKLRACEPKNPAVVGRPPEGETVCFIHIVGEKAAKVCEVVRGLDGRIVVEEMGTGEARPRREELSEERFDAVSAGWARYRGGFDGAGVTEARGEVLELAKPYSTGRFVLDRTTLGERLLGGSKSELKSERVLADEKMFARLPAGYDQKKPAGLLVWVSPMAEGGIPKVFWPALDEMNIVAIAAANSGNDRMVAERYQLALDAAATGQRRFHIDPRRVYITGMSGGGRVASMMAAGFPDVFTGAAPIVGLSTYERVPNGNGAYWPAGYRRPRGELWGLFRKHPMGAITGSEDFNQQEMTTAAEQLKKDGVNVRLFDYEGMGHEMPTPERFSEVMGWVDGAYQEVMKGEAEAAGKAMEVYKARKAAGAGDEEGRRLLMRVVEAGAWTGAAWEAVGELEAE